MKNVSKFLIFLLFIFCGVNIVNAKEIKMTCNYIHPYDQLSGNPEVEVKCDIYSDYSHMCYVTVPSQNNKNNKEKILNWSKLKVINVKDYVKNNNSCPNYLVVKTKGSYELYGSDTKDNAEELKKSLGGTRFIATNKDINSSEEEKEKVTKNIENEINDIKNTIDNYDLNTCKDDSKVTTKFSGCQKIIDSLSERLGSSTNNVDSYIQEGILSESDDVVVKFRKQVEDAQKFIKEEQNVLNAEEKKIKEELEIKDDSKEIRFSCNYSYSDPKMSIKCDVYEDYSHLCYMTISSENIEKKIENWDASILAVPNWYAKQYVKNNNACMPYLIVKTQNSSYEIHAASNFNDAQTIQGLGNVPRYILSAPGQDKNNAYKVYEPFKCVYETNFFNTSENAKKWVLETNEDGNKLVKGASSDGKSVEFDGDGIPTNGKCPDVSIYMKTSDTNYKIFANQQNCFDSFGSRNSNCSENLKGKKDNSATSPSNDTKSGVQYKLEDSSKTSCKYSNGKYGSLTINNKNDNISSKCENSTYLCTASIDNSKLFYKNDSFNCPDFLYTTVVLDFSSNTGRYKVNVYDAGSEDDDTRDENDPESGNAVNGSWNPKTLCGDNNEDCNIDITKFCTNPYVARTLKFLGLLLAIAKILVPAIIIILGFVDLANIVISGKIESVKKQALKLGSRVVIGIIIFLLPTILITIYNVAYSIANNSTKVTDGSLDVPKNFKNCVGCILDANNSEACIINQNEESSD